MTYEQLPVHNKGNAMMSLLKLLVVVVAGLAVALLVAGQAGMLRGAAPTDLGVKNRQLRPLANNLSSVSSQASLHASHTFRLIRARFQFFSNQLGPDSD